eukprot:m.160677 g.160677  ORF g.160677 m.160677 type:complete len:640 (+) comp31195_c0_seq2:321-2240(+)
MASLRLTQVNFGAYAYSAFKTATPTPTIGLRTLHASAPILDHERPTTRDARLRFRKRTLERKFKSTLLSDAEVETTSGMCLGFLQANIVILPSKHAANFKRFCDLNPQPCPLLCPPTNPGQFTSPRLANSSDIRSDVPAYRVYKHGQLQGVYSDISEFWTDDLVTFYLGCSFTFESVLAGAGIPVRNVEQNKNVAMYKTNIACNQVDEFETNMVVSMRPIPKHFVQLATEVTRSMTKAHGAPIHVGDPSTIGIQDLSAVDYGDALDFEDEDIACFWACGVTAISGAVSANTPICITHAPGSMFITDVPDDQLNLLEDKSQQKLATAIASLDAIVQSDPGNRGIAKLHVPGNLELAVAALYRAERVGVITGFPCNLEPPYCETDGPVGAVALARALVLLGKHVTLIADDATVTVVEAAKSACAETTSIDLVTYPHNADLSYARSMVDQFDHLVAIERGGQAANGKYYTMSARDMSHHCAPIDDLFLTRQGVPTTGVGDGGNELGMGRVLHRDGDAFANDTDDDDGGGGGGVGDIVACVTPSDYLLTAGVSNWGAYALCAGLALTHMVATENTPTCRACVASSQLETSILKAMTRVGCVCGITQQPMIVDGLAPQVHAQIHADIVAVVDSFLIANSSQKRK